MIGTSFSNAAGKMSRLQVYACRYYFETFLCTAGCEEDNIREYLQAGLTHCGYLSSWRDASTLIVSAPAD
jgi:hypothetical protein